MAKVRGEIDAVLGTVGVAALAAWAADLAHSPETRLLAVARAEAIFEMAAEARETRPVLDLDKVRASVAGLDALRWRDPTRYASLLDTAIVGGRDPVRREKPLEV